MSARQNDDRQSRKAREQQDHESADLSARDAQAALAFASPEAFTGPLAAQAPAPSEPAEPGAEDVESEAIPGPSMGDLLAGARERLRQ